MKDYLRIYQDEDGNFNFSHPEMNIGTVLALIGYMELVKRQLLEDINNRK